MSDNNYKISYKNYWMLSTIGAGITFILSCIIMQAGRYFDSVLLMGIGAIIAFLGMVMLIFFTGYKKIENGDEMSMAHQTEAKAITSGVMNILLLLVAATLLLFDIETVRISLATAYVGISLVVEGILFLHFEKAGV